MSKNFLEAMDKYIKRDTHATRSEFIRQSIREKIQRDAPELWSKMLDKINVENNTEVTQ